MSTEIRVQAGPVPVRPISADRPFGADETVRARQEPSRDDTPEPQSGIRQELAQHLREAVGDLNDYVQSSLRRELRFSIDEKSGRTMVRVIDSENGETIRQIPAEEVLAIERNLRKPDGLLLEEQV